MVTRRTATPAQVSTPRQRPFDFGTEVSLGNVPGFETLNRFGRATDVDQEVTDVWNRANTTDDQKIWIPPTQARVHNIVSTSTDDAGPSGTGAREILVFGLEAWDKKQEVESVIPNGTTPVATQKSWVVVHRLQVIDWGSAGPNVGTITATADVDGTVTAQIEVSFGQTQMAIRAIPSVQKVVLKSIYANLNKNATAELNFGLAVNPIPESELLGYQRIHPFAIQGAGTSSLLVPFDPPPSRTGPLIIKMQADGTANNIDVTAGINGYLVDV